MAYDSEILRKNMGTWKGGTLQVFICYYVSFNICKYLEYIVVGIVCHYIFHVTIQYIA